MSPSTSNQTVAPGGQVLRWRQALRARLAKPRLAWLDGRGLAAIEAAPGQALDLVASERLLQHLVCEPGLPLADEAALQGYARQLLSHYFGAAALRWPLAGWRAGGAAGASALHGLDLAALRATLEERQVALRGLRPAWAALLQRLAVDQPDWIKAPQAALAWVEGDLLTWLQLQAGTPRQLRHQRLAAPTVEALLATLTELQAQPGLPVLLQGYGLDAPQMPALPGVCQLGDLNGAAAKPAWFERPAAPTALAPRPDFAAPAEPPHRLAWPLALCGLLVLGTAGWSAWETHQQKSVAQARVESLQAQLQRRPAAPLPSSGSNKGADRAQAALAAEKLRAGAEVQGLLRHAWGPLLANVEQAGLGDDGAVISWLGMDYSAARRELRLQGLAADQAQALQLVERLALAPGWGEVVLSRFQLAGEGLSGQRFDLAAKLAPEALRADLARVSRAKVQP
ncbi:hypothetical protein G8A07_26030 [Roseateles sp. DAIF2]|uniref:hypothetical protein n=1 Tax=Roseateles sp. DAIF2 TaxID=2714952 RepID=UPI0018A336F1|nr:hypothetical protein [Roseateles sp. DAIF2]QPF76040.1 hypothetical protein G8A07_26030 [Roseateles sp. DAIF2]